MFFNGTCQATRSWGLQQRTKIGCKNAIGFRWEERVSMGLRWSRRLIQTCWSKEIKLINIGVLVIVMNTAEDVRGIIDGNPGGLSDRGHRICLHLQTLVVMTTKKGWSSSLYLVLARKYTKAMSRWTRWQHRNRVEMQKSWEINRHLSQALYLSGLKRL